MGGTRVGPPRWVASSALAVGVASVLLTIALLVWAWATGWNGVAGAQALGEVPWVLATAFGVAVGIVVQRRRPGLPATYFAVLLGAAAMTGLLDYVAQASGIERWGPWATAGLVWAAQTANIVSTLAAVFLLVTFPDGIVERPWERWIQRVSPVVLLVPAVLLVVNPVVTTPYWADRPDVRSPLHVPALAVDPDTASTLIDLVNVVLLVAAAAVVARYRRSGPARRARIRWVLLPMVVAAVGAVSGALLRPPNVFLVVLFIAVQFALYAAVALALLAPTRLDPDRVLRRSPRSRHSLHGARSRRRCGPTRRCATSGSPRTWRARRTSRWPRRSPTPSSTPTPSTWPCRSPARTGPWSSRWPTTGAAWNARRGR